MSIVKPLSLDCPLTLNRAVRDIASENPFLGSLISAMLVSYSDQRCRFRHISGGAGGLFCPWWTKNRVARGGEG